jgi:hypothetical protein
VDTAAELAVDVDIDIDLEIDLELEIEVAETEAVVETETETETEIEFIEGVEYSEVDKENVVDFQCVNHKKSGKLSYISPDIYAGRSFDARLSDCWSVSVTLLTLLLGRCIFHTPCVKKDPNFRQIFNGRLKHLLCSYKREQYLSPELFDFFNQTLAQKCESKRIHAQQMLNHPWMNLNII